jgi:hypothetical protein
MRCFHCSCTWRSRPKRNHQSYPTTQLAAREPREIKERVHWFIVDERNATKPMRDCAASAQDDVIITNTATEDFDATKIDGIMSCYRLLSIVSRHTGCVSVIRTTATVGIIGIISIH